MPAEVEDKVTPDCTKSTLDKAGDVTTGKADKVARYDPIAHPTWGAYLPCSSDAIPDSAKSTTQSVTDKASRVEGKGHGFLGHLKDDLNPKHIEQMIKHPIDAIKHTEDEIVHHHH